MKRFTFNSLCLSALFILLFTSCETNDVLLNTETINYLVKKTDWKRGTDDQSGDYWYYEFREPLLTQHIINKGMVALL